MIPDSLKYRESLPGSVTEIRAEEHRISLRWVAPNCSAVTRHAVSEGGVPDRPVPRMDPNIRSFSI